MSIDTTDAYLEAKAEIKDILREVGPENLKLDDEVGKIFDNDPDGLFREVLFQLVHVRMPRSAARETFGRLLEHRLWMARRLGRMISLRQAAYDYFTSVDPRLENPKVLSDEAYKELLSVSEKDTVTGLSNRLAFNRRFAQEVERAIRYRCCFTLGILDVDHFKEFNDLYGHRVGDLVLKTVSNIISTMTRKLDQAFRLGGDEFVLVLPEVTSEEGYHLVERVRREISHVAFEKQVTISCGLATFRVDTNDPQKLFTMADRALYRSKDLGRNCVTTYHEAKNPPTGWRRIKRFLFGNPDQASSRGGASSQVVLEGSQAFKLLNDSGFC